MKRAAKGQRLVRRIIRDEGFTLVETITTTFLAAVLLSVMVPLLMATTTSLTTSSKLVSAQAQAKLAIESMETQVESAAEVCFPTQYTSSGFSLRILQLVSTSESSGSMSDEYRWDQWRLSTSFQLLQEEESTVQPTTEDTGIDWTGGWRPVATGISNQSTGSSPTPPFSPVTPADGSPEGLSVDLLVNGGTAGTPGTMQLTTDYAAFSTPYAGAGSTGTTGDSSNGSANCANATPAD